MLGRSPITSGGSAACLRLTACESASAGLYGRAPLHHTLRITSRYCYRRLGMLPVYLFWWPIGVEPRSSGKRCASLMRAASH
jgi:hypothetical protein